MSKVSSFCPYPWEHLFVDNFGNFLTCCIAGKSVVWSGPETINAQEKNGILKHWNSQYMQQIRKSMVEGKRHTDCSACWRVEDLGDKSFRHMAMEEGIFLSEQDASDCLPLPVFKLVDLRFGNACNLACRMCIPYNSRKLLEEYSELEGPDSQNIFRKMDWYENDDFWEELLSYIDHTKRIHLAGGEPLLIKHCWKFLRRLVEQGKSKDMILSYNTNLSVIPDEARELWPEFKGVYAIVSMDGVGKVNEFIRWPSKWEDLDRNLRDIDSNFAKYNIKISQIHVTSQVYNIMRTEEICDYVAGFRNISRIPRFDLLWNPKQFNVQVLPSSYREEAASRMEAYIEKIKRGHNNLELHEMKELSRNIQSLISQLRSPGRSEDFHLFKRHTDIYDRHRNQRTFDYLPELESAYKATND